MLNFMANKKPIWDRMSQSEACNEHEFVCIITYRNLCSSRWTGQVSWCHGVLVNYDNYTLSYIRAVGRNTRNLTLSSTDLCVSEGRDCDSSWQVWSVMTYNWLTLIDHEQIYIKWKYYVFRVLWFLSCVNLSWLCLSFPVSYKKPSSHLLSWAELWV